MPLGGSGRRSRALPLTRRAPSASGCNLPGRTFESAAAQRDRPRAHARGACRKARHAAREGAQGAQDRREPLSLETPIGDEEDSHLGDFIEDKNAILPIDAVIQSNLRETTTRTLASL